MASDVNVLGDQTKFTAGVMTHKPPRVVKQFISSRAFGLSFSFDKRRVFLWRLNNINQPFVKSTVFYFFSWMRKGWRREWTSPLDVRCYRARGMEVKHFVPWCCLEVMYHGKDLGNPWKLHHKNRARNENMSDFLGKVYLRKRGKFLNKIAILRRWEILQDNLLTC